MLTFEPFFHPWVQRSGAVLLHRYPRDANEDSIREYLEALYRFSQTHRERYGAVVDLRDINPILTNARHRKLFSDSTARLSSFARQYTAGMGIVVSNSAQRGLMTAVYWLSPPAYPYRVTGSVEEAIRWVQGQLAKPHH